jgi:hypothetical protein
MKKNLFALLLLVGVVFASCKKDTPTVIETGTIRYNNNSTGGNRYELFLDGGSLGLLDADSFYDETDIPVGSHIVKAVQFEGYILAPTIVENTVVVTNGVTLQFDFP